MNLLNKKAAMFGLDARIALAIFGALSVISGAALYGAIQQAKAIALITEMREVAKAWEQYYLDTGEYLPVRSTDENNSFYYSYKTSDLASSSIKGWKGPYLPYTANADYLVHPVYGNVHMEKSTKEDWSATDWATAKCDDVADICYNWVNINGINDASLINKLDEIVDNGDGAGAGDLRWEANDLNGRVSLNVGPIKNPVQ